MIVRLLATLVAVSTASGLANADSEPAPPPLTAEDVRTAPRPGDEHGRLDPIDPGDGPWRRIGRTLLWIPRIPFEVVMQPIRGALYAQERYHLVQAATDVLYNDDRTIGVYPTALIETGFGLNVGARAVFKELFGLHERIKLRAGFGGEFRRIAAIDLDTGKRISGVISAGIDGRYELRDREHFYGYGNGNVNGGLATPAMPIDPTVDETAVATRFFMRVAKVSPRIKVHMPHHLTATVTGALISKEYGTTGTLGVGETPIGDAFDLAHLPGFEDGTRFLYNELELAWDTRGRAWDYDPPGIRGTGSLLLAYGARQQGLTEGPRFYRAGIDLQRYVALTRGPRVLELRLWGEMVSGDRDEIPFTELPRIGGKTLLRGYPTDRFRDRVATVAQVGYLWALGYDLAMNVFVDAGRVHPSLHDLSVDNLRVGFGVALEAYSRRGMLVRAELASSVDGGLFGYISVEPVFDARSRVERN